MSETDAPETDAAAFLAARDRYRELRGEQVRVAREYLKAWLARGFSAHRFFVYDARGAGHGRNVNGKDLRDWRWIEVKRAAGAAVGRQRDGESVLLISFQAPDLDVNSGNRHVLFDRIALMDAGSDGFDGSGRCEVTGLALPLDGAGREALWHLVARRLGIGG